MSTKIDLELERGTDNRLVFVLTDDDDKAIDISADDVEMNVKDDFGGNLIFKKTSSAGSHFNGPDGQVEFIVDRTDIDDEALIVADTFWVYEIRRIDGGDASESVHVGGSLTVIPSVGR